MKTSFSLLLSLCCISLNIYSKDLAESTKKQLLQNGVVLLITDNQFSDHQYYLLETFDFNSYRNYTTNRLIQISDGPIIRLNSLKEMEQLGKIIPNEYLLNKKDEIIDTNLKQVITLVDIGFKYGPLLNTESGF